MLKATATPDRRSLGAQWGGKKNVHRTHPQSQLFFFFFTQLCEKQLFIFISWRLITLQYCSGFCHTLTWISHGFTCVPHPDPPPASLSIPSLWVFPMHQPWALVSCIQPGLVICFTLDSILVSMLFSQNIQKSVLYICPITLLTRTFTNVFNNVNCGSFLFSQHVIIPLHQCIF